MCGTYEYVFCVRGYNNRLPCWMDPLPVLCGVSGRKRQRDSAVCTQVCSATICDTDQQFNYLLFVRPRNGTCQSSHNTIGQRSSLYYSTCTTTVVRRHSHATMPKIMNTHSAMPRFLWLETTSSGLLLLLVVCCRCWAEQRWWCCRCWAEQGGRANQKL